MSVDSVMLSSHLMHCCLLFLLPSVFPSIEVFSRELVTISKFNIYKPKDRTDLTAHHSWGPVKKDSLLKNY